MKRQLAELLLDQCRKTVPFYKTRGSGGWNQLAPISKRVLKSSLGELLYGVSDDQRRTITEMVAAVSPAVTRLHIEGPYRLERTSGTSGVAIWIPRYRWEAASLSASTWAARQRIMPGLSPRNFAAINQFHATDPGNCEDIAVRWVNVGEKLFKSNQEIDALAKKFPEAAIIEYIGGYVSPEREREVASRTGWKVVSQYGTIETWTIAHGTQSIYRSLPSILVEILDERGQPITEVGRIGRIHITALTQRLVPILRYDVGDSGEWIDYREEKFKLSSARSFESLRLKDGRLHSGKEIFRSIVSTIDQTEGDLRIEQVRIVQKTEHLFVLYLNATAQKGVEQLFEQAVNGAQLFGGPVKFTRRDFNELSDGKSLLFVSEVLQ